MLAQRIEKETVSAQPSKALFRPCLLPVGTGSGSLLPECPLSRWG